jgi:hypothetical protein
MIRSTVGIAEECAMRYLLTAATALSLCGSGRADVVTLVTTAPPGTPLVVNPGATSTPLSIKVVNNINPDAPASFMTAWAMNLVIVPDAGTTGSLAFANPTTGGNSPLPPGYVFPGSFTGLSVTNNGTTLKANDFDSVAAGTQVPTALGALLLQPTFSASPAASGLFGVYAVEGSNATEWTDAASTPMTHFFSNVPSGTGMVRIADIQVSAVPEPGTWVLTSLVAVAGGWSFRRRVLAGSHGRGHLAIRQRAGIAATKS